MHTGPTSTQLPLDTIRGIIFDMDGVLYRGNHPLPGAREIFPALRGSDLSFILLTNNSTLTRRDYVAKLARMGILLQEEEILTSAVATAQYLAENYPEGGDVYVLGEAGLVETISQTPRFRADGWQPRFVVAGLHFGFTYDHLQRACGAIRNGAHFIATNADVTLPVEGGELWPGAGSLIAAVQACSGVAPVVIGKPSARIGELALERLGLQAQEVLCVGDRLDTDILMGNRAGMPTALVLTGISRREDVAASEAKPDFIFDDIPTLMSALKLERAYV